jgi:hypothetical protein
MNEAKDEHLKVVEALALQSMMAEADDIAGLGSILENLEILEKATATDDLPAAVRPLVGLLKKLVEKIILNEVTPPQQGLELLGDGVKLVQSKVTAPGREGASAGICF